MRRTQWTTFMVMVMFLTLSTLSKLKVHSWVVSASVARIQRLQLFSAISSVHGDNDALYQELKSLNQELLKHDNFYYNLGQPVLSDEEYDALASREAQLCRDNPLLVERLNAEGISSRYGGNVGTTPQIQERLKRTHLVPMLSLENMHSTKDVEKWIQRICKRLPNASGLQEMQIITEPKIDGLSLSLRYNQLGVLQWAATRGDGKQGQDVTLAVSDMRSIPTRINPMTTGSEVEVRGEVVLPQSVFQSILEVDQSFSNARNAASGIILRKSSNSTLRQSLQFYAYDMVGPNLNETTDIRQNLVAMGFQVPEPHCISLLTFDENGTNGLDPMFEYHEELQNHKLNRPTNLSFGDYEMDGAVHKVASVALRSILGASNRAPRWAMAHKFESQTSLTKLLNVEVQIGRTGVLTPVAHLEPVDIKGVNVQRATLHNFLHLQQMMGATQVPIGTPVLVRRAGEVIPQVVRRLNMDEENKSQMISLEPPTLCPACSSPVIWEESQGVGKGQILRCSGPSLKCPPRMVGALVHAFSRDAIDIRGLSEARIEQLTKEGLLNIPSDLFRLAESSSSAMSDDLFAKISDLPGWGPKSAQNLMEAVTKVVHDGVSLGRFIYSLGIRYTGQHTSNLVASIYGNVDALLLDMENANDLGDASFAILREETDETKGIGPVLISSFQSFAREKDLVEAARALASVIKVKEEPSLFAEADKASEGKPWRGLSVVFTGSLPTISRSEAQELAKAVLGVKSTPDAVSKSTDLIVAGEKGGKKLAKAAELGVQIVDAQTFIELIRSLQGDK